MYGAETFLKRLFGRTDIQVALRRLDDLTKAEGLITAARNLGVTHHVDGNVAVVKKVIHDVERDVMMVKEVIRDAHSTVKESKELTRQVGVSVNVLEDVARNVGDDVKAIKDCG